MAKAKNLQAAGKDETLTEKAGHLLGNMVGAIREKYNEFVHPETAPEKKTVRKKTATPKAGPRKTAAPVAKNAARKNIPKAGSKKTGGVKRAENLKFI